MVRLSSKDASLLIEVLEHSDLPNEDRLKLLEGADPKVIEIGTALIYPDQQIRDPEVEEAVEQIREWAKTTKQILEERRLYA